MSETVSFGYEDIDATEKTGRVGEVSLRDRFALDPSRSQRLAGPVGDLWVDWSRHPIDDEVLGLLGDLADQRDVSGFCARMLAGEPVNATEGRAATHTALRAPDGHADIGATLDRMADLAGRIRDGSYTGATGAPIRAVVSLGIGGSYLGPAMAHEALAHLAHPEVTVRFSSSRPRRPRSRLHPRGDLFEVVHHARDHGRRRYRTGVAAGGRR